MMIHRCRDQMLVHRQGQCRRWAVPGKLAKEPAHGAVGDSPAAKVRGNERRANLVPFQYFIVFSDKNVARVALVRTFKERRSDSPRERLQVEMSVHGQPPIVSIERLRLKAANSRAAALPREAPGCLHCC